MASVMLGPLLLALLVQDGAAAIMAAPRAAITPAPVLKRAVTTIGYISTREYDGTTYWDTITANEQGNAIATSSNLFQICDPAKPCTFFSCSGDYVIMPSSSIFCGGESSTCSYWELATDINDKTPLTNYWCDAKTSVGGIIYRTTPEAAATNTAASTTSTRAAPSITFTSATNIATDVTSISSSGPGLGETNDGGSLTKPKKKSSTPIGPIVGGVVGGVAVLAGIIIAIWMILKRKKKNKTDTNNITQTAQVPPAAPPAVQQNAQQPPAGVQYYHEQKPVSQPQVQQVPPPQPYGHYDPNAQPAPAQPFYDPNAQTAYAQQSQAGYGAPSPDKTPAPLATGQQTHAYYADNAPISPVPQYSPSPSPAIPANVSELSSSRM
ncbi:hypothetical protein COCMIDRAFT_81522 [Bipolaris oryzae ATCC 44560]|uniref:Mid2 domain-containing protein n=1 Tax=Bipolaris oryzae ATCC 44560 TaxID=930090 RepID=W6ZSV1_COCMI|nr:uncharacterized protein COCMIDRAFT_81522 [Bipolaris oryzae ATCC 44560]EUC50599.1 hypothetical protein COCMIDRAFT_81522 [Bipolaris oryzae ATCC 44560]